MLSHTPPPGATDGEQPSGGKSLLVDGFHAAKELRNSFPTYYRELLLRLPWHASGNEGVAICPDWTYPVIELERPSTRNRKPMLEREIGRIRWNNDDRASKLHSPIHHLPVWLQSLLRSLGSLCGPW